MTYNGLDMLHKVIEVNKSKLSFKMSELAQVATSVTTFEFSKCEVSMGIGHTCFQHGNFPGHRRHHRVLGDMSRDKVENFG